MKKTEQVKRFLFVILVIAACVPLLFNRCANTSRGPSGGPRDSIPPVLIKSVPENQAKNFTDKRITLTFNEFVKLKDQSKNLVISPPLKKAPIIRLSGKNIIIQFQSELLPETTYSIDFGQAIVDNNEGNPLGDYEFTFSTGSGIDTLRTMGQILNAYTLVPEEGISVFLYSYDFDQDSLPMKELPVAVARTNKDGIYTLRGLGAKPYKIFAVEDKNSNNKYDPGSERIAFLDTLIQPNLYDYPIMQDTTSIGKDTVWVDSRDFINLRLADDDVKKQYLISYKRTEERRVELIFNQRWPVIEKLEMGNLTKADYIQERSMFNDTLIYWLKAKTLSDTLATNITYLRTDSINQLSPFDAKLRLTYKKPVKTGARNQVESSDELIISPSISVNPRTVTDNGVQFKFPAPLIYFDTTNIQLFQVNERTKQKRLVPFSVTHDTLRICNYSLKANWIAEARYELLILPEAFVDIYTRSNDSILQTVLPPLADKYGTFIFDFTGVDGQYIVQLLLNGKNLIQEKLITANGNCTFPFLDAGKYEVRIVQDRNSNGIWDIGHYLEKRQPERTEFFTYHDESGQLTRTLNMRLGWEIKQAIDLSVMFKK